MNTRSYKMVLALAVLFLFTAAVLFFLGFRLYSTIAALFSISLFYYNSFEGFSTRNTVSYSLSSITIKLVGRKTLGFRFKEMEQLDLSEKGLYIKVKEMDVVTLSRKRYHDKSLEQLHKILNEKTI